MPQAMETDSANRLRISVMRLARLLRRTEAGDGAELSPTRVAVLLNVVRNGPVRLSQVAEEEGLNPTLLSRTVARLTEVGLVARSADHSDRRSAWLEPTDAGLELAATIRRQRAAAFKRALDALDDDERIALEGAAGALESLAEALGR